MIHWLYLIPALVAGMVIGFTYTRFIQGILDAIHDAASNAGWRE